MAAKRVVDPQAYEDLHRRVSVGDWLGLWWQGRVDARRRLPRLTGSDAPQTVLPQVEVIRRQAGEVCETERLRLLADLAALGQRGGQAQARLAALRAELGHHEQRLDELAAAGPRRDLRRRGEEHVEPWLVARRREREHARDVEDARTRVAGLRQEVERVGAELDAVAQLVASRRSQAGVAANRHVEHAERRMALYWRALLRRHGQRSELAHRWSLPTVGVPGWIAEEAQ